MNSANISTEVAAAVGQIVLQSQMGLSPTTPSIPSGKNLVLPAAIPQKEYDVLLQMPLWQMTGAQYKSLIETIILHLLPVIQIMPEKKYVYGIDGLAKLIGKSKNTAQRMKKSGIIDDAIIQDGRTIIIDPDQALNLIREHEAKTRAENKAKIQLSTLHEDTISK